MSAEVIRLRRSRAAATTCRWVLWLPGLAAVLLLGLGVASCTPTPPQPTPLGNVGGIVMSGGLMADGATVMLYYDSNADGTVDTTADADMAGDQFVTRTNGEFDMWFHRHASMAPDGNEHYALNVVKGGLVQTAEFVCPPSFKDTCNPCIVASMTIELP